MLSIKSHGMGKINPKEKSFKGEGSHRPFRSSSFFFHISLHQALLLLPLLRGGGSTIGRVDADSAISVASGLAIRTDVQARRFPPRRRLLFCVFFFLFFPRLFLLSSCCLHRLVRRHQTWRFFFRQSTYLCVVVTSLF